MVILHFGLSPSGISVLSFAMSVACGLIFLLFICILGCLSIVVSGIVPFWCFPCLRGLCSTTYRIIHLNIAHSYLLVSRGLPCIDIPAHPVRSQFHLLVLLPWSHYSCNFISSYSYFVNVVFIYSYSIPTISCARVFLSN